MWAGITDWKNLGDINAMYPLQGYEWIFVLAAVIYWVWWQIQTIRDENQEMREASSYYRRIGVAHCMSLDGKARRETSSPSNDPARSRGRTPMPSRGEL